MSAGTSDKPGFDDLARQILAEDQTAPVDAQIDPAALDADGRLSKSAVRSLHRRFRQRVRKDVAKLVDHEAQPDLAHALTRLHLVATRACASLQSRKLKELVGKGIGAIRAATAQYTTGKQLESGLMGPVLDAAWQKRDTLFAPLFGDEDRIYLPFTLPEQTAVQPLIEAHLAEQGFAQVDYRAGLASKDGKNPVKIGRLLAESDPVLAKAYNTDASRSGEFTIMISRDPYDVAGMSADRPWRSCIGPKSSFWRYGWYMRRNLQGESLVAYLVSANDPLALRPMSRIHIKPYYDGNGKADADAGRVLYAGKSYGIAVSGFRQQLQAWLDHAYNHDKTGSFKRGIAYLDINESAKIGRVAPGQDIEAVLKQLEIGYDKGFTGKITVKGDLNLTGLDYLPKGLDKIAVTGSLNVSGIPMDDFTGLPAEIGRSLIATNCGLKSWQGVPAVINRNLDVSSNNFVDLVGSPQQVRRQFRLGANPLVSFEGAPARFGEIKLNEFEFYNQRNLPARPKAAEPRPGNSAP